MALTNLGLMLEVVTAEVRRAIGPPTKPARVRKAIVTRTRRNGLSESAEKGAETAKAKERAKEKEKAKQMAAESGREKARGYRAQITTWEMAIASLATIVASRMMGRKEEIESKLPWRSKAPQRNKRKK